LELSGNHKWPVRYVAVEYRYGILVFVFQYGSRRAANAEITRPMFAHNLRLLFPQLESLPHSDTLFRLLWRIDVGAIEQAHIALVNHLIRNKKLTRYLINNCLPLGIDGTQRIAFSDLRDEHLLQRRIGLKADPDSNEAQRLPVLHALGSLSQKTGRIVLDVRRAGGDRLYPQCPHRSLAGFRADQAAAKPTLSITLALTPARLRLPPLA